MIKPTPGRIVWYRPSENDGMTKGADGQPLAAIVTYVHGDRCVNLSVFDANGRPHPKTSVTLQQEESPPLALGSPYCEWMPYQKSVASGAIAPNIHAGDVKAVAPLGGAVGSALGAEANKAVAFDSAAVATEQEIYLRKWAIEQAIEYRGPAPKSTVEAAAELLAFVKGGASNAD